MLELSVAPMMEWTTRHQRYLARLIAKRTVLYTEMVVDQTIKHRTDDLGRWLGHHKAEHPLVLQLGGNDVEDMTNAAVLGEQWGFDEINLNVGCPSMLVSKQEFGASLMLKPEIVRSLVCSIQKSVKIPVTVKCRLGVDEHDSYDFVKTFVQSIPECDHFIIHARKCILQGLTPHGNRTIPPLQYDRVYRLCRDFPQKKFSLNGGITSVEDVQSLMKNGPELHGVMVGRAAFNNPILLAELEHLLYGETHGLALTRREIIEQYREYCHEMKDHGFTTMELMKPLGMVCLGIRNGKRFRLAINQSSLSKTDRRDDIDSLLDDAMGCLRQEDLDRPILARLKSVCREETKELEKAPHGYCCD